MRADSSSNNSNPVNPYNAATEKTVVARRSFQIRKKIAKRAANNQAWAGFGRAPMMAEWMSGGRSQTNAKEQRQTNAKTRG